jgi:hypothetical protein
MSSAQDRATLFALPNLELATRWNHLAHELASHDRENPLDESIIPPAPAGDRVVVVAARTITKIMESSKIIAFALKKFALVSLFYGGRFSSVRSLVRAGKE